MLCLLFVVRSFRSSQKEILRNCSAACKRARVSCTGALSFPGPLVRAGRQLNAASLGDPEIPLGNAWLFQLLAAVFGAIAGKEPQKSTHDCPENEIYGNCKACEGYCGGPSPLCSDKCQGAGCYCPYDAGFQRVSNGGNCVAAADCPQQ